MTTTQPDSMTKDEGLLPCPFCGREAEPEHLEGGAWSIGCPDDDCIGYMSVATFARKAEAIAAWNRRSTPSSADNALMEAAKDVVDRAFDHYRARNGRMCSIEGDDGEKCWIVPFDAMEDLRQALTSSPAAEVEPVAWMYERERNEVERAATIVNITRWSQERASGWTETPLYAAPVSPTPVEAGALREKEICPYCNGCGEHDASGSPCAVCNGSGGIDPDEEAYEMGMRDGYEQAIADVDRCTGGDGEYFASTIPGQGCPDWQSMVAKIVDRFTALSQHGGSKSGGWLPIETAPHACHVLATYFDTLIGEWICEFIPSPPSGPWTHFMFVQPPSTPSSKER